MVEDLNVDADSSSLN